MADTGAQGHTKVMILHGDWSLRDVLPELVRKMGIEAAAHSLRTQALDRWIITCIKSEASHVAGGL